MCKSIVRYTRSKERLERYFEPSSGTFSPGLLRGSVFTGVADRERA